MGKKRSISNFLVTPKKCSGIFGRMAGKCRMSETCGYFTCQRQVEICFIFLLLLSVAYAHVGEEEKIYEEKAKFEYYTKSASLDYLLTASAIVLILILLSLLYKEKTEKVKWLLFLGIIIPTMLATAYLAGSTIYLNLISETKGPVHWHADFEIWNCGEKISLIEPKGLSNRVGTAVLHEHNDDRIHVEGVVVEKKDADLHSFFEVVGGSLTNDYLAVPANDEIIEVRNGDLCNGKHGEVQVFVYKIINPENVRDWTFKQEKMEDFQDYLLSPYANIPPGDCIIIEFSEEKGKTRHLCETYKSAMQRGELSGS